LSNESGSLFDIMFIIVSYMEGNLLSRIRYINNKEYSFMVIATNKINLRKVINYFTLFPLLFYKNLDYIDWCNIFNLRNNNRYICSYLEEALKIKHFKWSQTTFDWDY
jgi:LAGLIDADG endonuclease